MDELVMPKPLAGPRIERQQTIAVKIRPLAIRTVQVVSRRSEREVRDLALFVHRNLAPRIHPTRGLPGVLRPRLVTELAGMRDCVERPDELAAQDVVRAQIAGRIAVALARRGAEDDQVLENATGSAALDIADALRVAPEALAQIDPSVVAERVDGDARLEIDLLEEAVRSEDQAFVAAVLALPVIEAAVRRPALDGVRPDLAARRCIERYDRAVLPDDAHHAVDH